ncbi:baseplate wedge protein [Caudoviricetes sp.]|nr:baseplate wedge protein [Caudoviricetes sp.]
MTQYTKPTVLPAWGESAGGADVLQPTNAEIQAGWPLSNVPPSRKRFNWILKYLAQGVRYMMQMGIPAWDATEDYPVNARVMGSDGKTYKAILTSTNQNPVSAPTYWTRWGFTLAEYDAEGTTPAQFDNSVKRASTAFVQRALGSWASARGLSSATTLTNADFGTQIQCAASAAYTITMMSTTGVPVGAAFRVCNLSGSNITLQAVGSDKIVSPVDGTNTATTFVIPTGTDAFVICTANNQWGVYGTATLAGSPLFASSKSASGYQKLPGGLIIQWGQISAANGTGVTVSLPIAFPNGALAMTASHNGGGSSTSAVTAVSLTTTTAYLNNFNAGAVIPHFYIAIGY